MVVDNRAQQYLDANPDVKAEYEQLRAEDPEKWTPETYAEYHFVNYGAKEGREGGGYKEAVDSLTQQILSQGTASQWKGEGYGSAEATARDMATRLAGAGITDINQFGVREKVLKGGEVYSGYDQASTGDIVSDRTVQEYYNKETGQPVSAYYDKAQGNTWSGTFAGKGSTSYKVNFEPDGTPVFYTQFGGSSNDLSQIVNDNMVIRIAANVAAASFGGPMGVAALHAAMGEDIKSIAKATALAYVGGEISSGVSGAQATIDTLGQAGANIAGRAAGAIATGQDPLTAVAMGGFGQTVGEGIGLSGTAASTVGSSLVAGVTAELRNKDVNDAMIAGALSGYLSGEKNIALAKQAADADIAGGLIPEYGSNTYYDNFMSNAMTPEAMTSIQQGIQDRAGVGTGYDATEFEGSLAKEAEPTSSMFGDVFKPSSGSDLLKTGFKAALAGGAVAAGGAAINSLVNRPSSTTSAMPDMSGIDIYKDAPIKGYHMEQDPATGRYIPYIGDRPLLAKGGFVSKRN
jgi:hypothetical protein